MRATPPTDLAAPRAIGDPLGPLATRLRAADGILQRERAGQRLLRSWPWVAVFWVACFAADVVLHLAAGPRVALSAAFLLLALGGAGWCGWLAWGKRNTFAHIARVLESRHARLGSRLMNLLQLRAQVDDPALAPLTREMAGHAVAGYADELKNEPLEQLARTDTLRREAKRAGWWLLGFVAAGALFFDLTRTELLRFADPFGDHPPFSFTRIEIADPGDDTAQVIYGGSILVTARASGHRPGELFLTHHPAGHPEQAITAPMFDKGNRGFTQQIEGIKSELTVFAHTKDRHSLSKQRRIGLVRTPKLEHAWVTIAPPAYTGLPPREQPLQFKNLKALQGSTLTFRLQSNRPLAEGGVDLETAPGEVQHRTLTASAEHEVSGSITALHSGRLKFSVLDVEGHPSIETWELALTVTHDLPPEVEVRNPDGDSFVAMDFKVEPVVEASDDYGVKTLRIHLARNGKYDEPRVVTLDPPAIHARDSFTLNLREMDLASGDTLSYFAEAIDNAPEPHLARSKTVTLTVITTEEYNDFLREQTDLGDIEAKYSKLLNEFHDAVERQKELGKEIEALKQQAATEPDEKTRAAQQQQLDAQLARQAAINQQLDRLAETMENFVRDQPLYDIEVELKTVLQQKAQEIRESTKLNEETRGQIAQQSAGSQSAPSPEALGDFKKASDEQLARLGVAEQEVQEQIAAPLEDLSLLHEIVKDINRFKELYEAQKQLAEQAKAYDRETPLNREDQLALKDLAAREKAIGEELDAVEQRLWEDGKAAEEKFPKAGKSAQKLAQMMGDLRLQTHANNATRALATGQGSDGANLAEHLRGEMEKMFSQCNGKEGEMNDELDQKMAIQRSLNPKGTFRQMMQTRKFGNGQRQGQGRGTSGSDGYAVQVAPHANVLGNESRLSESERARMSGQGRNQAVPDGAKPEVVLDKADVVQGVQETNRQSEAIQGETTVDQYRDIVEKYFRAITK
jgi:hypothetical protein